MPGLLTIRADAGPDIGTGHVMRMLALAQAWADRGGRVHFVGRVLSPPLCQRILQEGFAHSAPPDREDLEFLLRHSAPGDWVALDGYHFDHGYMTALRASGRKTLVLDDANDRGSYAADLLLNPNIGAGSIAYRLDAGARLLPGLPYALIRREFLAADRAPLGDREHPKRILVTMGGADPLGITPALLRAIAALGRRDLEVLVLAGSANPRLAELARQAAAMPCKTGLLAHVDDMAARLRWADAALAPVSGTCWELLYMRVPFVSIAFAACQRLLKDEFRAAGVPMLEWGGERFPELAREALLALLDGGARQFAQLETSGVLVDGMGARRVVEAMLAHSASTAENAPKEPAA